ncbi:regulatory protein GemA [Candidatus Persebacteraceae bacterium Df01]|jgi:hypothetical protein|uniref:Regulatory protein GemA n=1 Tax=Candidatus Doriopsillibacter californiensis TaxID=2970740 RepID=A0ABT7QLV5_9GAMM|nr:regulatory protein GemA [Candidatus Persebacteraceae bacterium Df01]
MTNPSNRRNLLARLHVLKKEYALDDDTYRAKLYVATKKTTAADCTNPEIKKAINAFDAPSPPPEFDNKKIKSKCWAQAFELTGGNGTIAAKNYLQGLAKKMTAGKDFFTATGGELHDMAAAMAIRQNKRR